jgi:hypothetical protein
MVYVANLRGCSNSSDATPERTATAVVGIQEIDSAFGAAVQLKGSSRMLRNTFVQYLIMVAGLLRVPKYIQNRSSVRSKNVEEAVRSRRCKTEAKRAPGELRKPPTGTVGGRQLGGRLQWLVASTRPRHRLVDKHLLDFSINCEHLNKDMQLATRALSQASPTTILSQV